MERRGAPFTFDKSRFKNDLLKLKENKEGSFPSFDHAKKDPLENDIHVTKEHKIVIIEVIYHFFFQDIFLNFLI